MLASTVHEELHSPFEDTGSGSGSGELVKIRIGDSVLHVLSAKTPGCFFVPEGKMRTLPVLGDSNRRRNS